MNGRCTLVVCFVMLAGSLKLPAAEPGFRATLVRTMSDVGEPSMHLPTDVAVSPSGTVYVADGVHSRVLAFNSDGQFLTVIDRVGDHVLERPLGLDVDSAGVLWIADAGSGQILARHPDGSLARRVVCYAPASGVTPDIADVAVDIERNLLWVTDNDNHRLTRYELGVPNPTFIGHAGVSLGEWRYPYLLDCGPNGDVFVAEALNARVQILNAAGAFDGSIGLFGVDVGNFFRPKGIVVDEDSNVWVADGTLGVIQVFRPTGILLGVLRDAEGEVLRFDTPHGIDLRKNHLYVCEQMPGRVSQFRLDIDPRAMPLGLTRSVARARTSQPQACAVCHLEWVYPLPAGEGTLFVSPPELSPTLPLVSRAEMCLSCHDGCIDDSRERVWIKHGHGTGIPVPAGMTVPDHLPLADGVVACRTCHSAHTGGAPTADIATAVFLRVDQHPGELCAECHTDLTAAALGHMHPLGRVDQELPGELRTHPAQRRTEMDCCACHAAHGSAADPLLKLDTADNALCTACHAPDRLAPITNADQLQHGLTPVTAPAGVVLGDHETTFRCRTCHAMHEPNSGRALLILDVTSACAQCHPQQSSVSATNHNLARMQPDTTNRFGTPASVGGTCSSCHGFHAPAREPVLTQTDLTGNCVTCHRADGPAGSKVLGDNNHSTVGCSKCHDAHVNSPNFIAGAAQARCTSCHMDHAKLASGPHDVRLTPGKWPAASRQTQDQCLACHRPHGTPTHGRYRVVSAEAPGSDAACLACHADAAPRAESTWALQHPLRLNDTARDAGLPLVTKSGETQQTGCITCHAPHTAKSHLMRIESADAEELCLRCHADHATIHTIGHADRWLSEAGFETAGCQPCHITHASPDKIEPAFLWPAALAADPGKVTFAPDRHCVACHHAGGPVAPPTIATHPDVEMYNPQQPEDAGFLPLFDATGEIDPKGHIACRTCHLTHGRTDPAPVPAGGRTLGARELRARVWHLRSLGGENVCTTCHGFDALRRFMYFHDPGRRSGPLDATRTPASP